ncbi:hypothetical protein H0H81_012219 [Sphagnurus paluster]|uniref:Ras GEF n=1 Tax=Sphagnurus paluster TaxID=117069 RepID=A0A9P7FWR4_9AGAR|nr:hypothetical protein H0H81_012219 [Sphagnurus paluster]
MLAAHPLHTANPFTSTSIPSLTDDPDHLPFQRNEILDIVKQEESGWWAAIRTENDQIGWIPQAFVEPIDDETADRLRHTRQDLRCYEYNAEQLYTSASTDSVPPPYEPAEPGTPAPPSPRVYKRIDQAGAPQIYVSTKAHDLVNDSDPSYRLLFQYLQQYEQNAKYPKNLESPHSSPYYSHSNRFLSPAEEDTTHGTPNRAGTLSTITTAAAANAKRRDNYSVPRLRPLLENASGEAVLTLSKNALGGLIKRTKSGRMKTPADTIPRPAEPWYLKPVYSDQLEVDADGNVRFGTLKALVEKLTCEASPLDTQKMAEETLFRNIFLMTFRTFTTADVLFEMLVATYRMDHPKDLATAEFEEWKGHLIATQRRVLMIFTMWLEDHRLLEQEPQIASRLTEFLGLILQPPLASMARLLVKTISRLTFSIPSISPTASPTKARKSRAHKNDLLKLDPIDVAEQLTLLEYRRYVRVTPQDCLGHSNRQASGESNLTTFCGTHDRVVSWVKVSILSHDGLGKRASTIEFWIKVAEKCKLMNNFASMSAVIIGLSSTVISRLHLTWAHVSRKNTLDALLKYNEPTGGFAGYRSLLQAVEGPCVPFIIMYLTDLVHIQDHYTDEGERICFLQRQRSYETVSAILRYQTRAYGIAESESTMSFICRHLGDEFARDSSWFWMRSQEVQQSELAHADIRKGLEAAGF